LNEFNNSSLLFAISSAVGFHGSRFSSSGDHSYIMDVYNEDQWNGMGWDREKRWVREGGEWSGR
jgi:hypothetical protein